MVFSQILSDVVSDENITINDESDKKEMVDFQKKKIKEKNLSTSGQKTKTP